MTGYVVIKVVWYLFILWVRVVLIVVECMVIVSEIIIQVGC